MEAGKKQLQKPALSSHKKINIDSIDKKLSKIEIYYRYSH